MKHFKCENCGSDLKKNADDTYSCSYCKRTYYDDSLEKAYERVYQNLHNTVRGVVTEELLKQKIEQIANCRRALYKARNGQFVDSKEIGKWSEEILKLCPDDAQANFYAMASKKRWSELNKFMQKLNAREVSYLVEGFVDYLTNGQFVEKCILSLNDLIGRAFDSNSKEYAECHKKIAKAAKNEKSGIFDVELSRDVFVAYSSKDKEEAYELVEHLEENGFSCFIAMRNLAKGVDAELKYNERLKKAIDNCQVFVLVSSKNSRSRDCDAFNIEMRYVKEKDIARAENRDYASAHYELYLEKNRRRCKARVEYLIEDYGVSRYEQEVKKFFGGLTWCTEKDAVTDVVFDYIENAGLEESEEERLSKEKAELEKRLAKIKKEKAEADHQAELAKLAREKELEKAKLEAELERAKLEAELEELKKKKQSARGSATQTGADSGNIDDLYKAFKERERAEEEEKKRLEEERKQKESLLRQGFQIENGVLNKYVGTYSKVVIPNCVTSIGKDAFVDCCKNLKSVTIPASVTKIERNLFRNCEQLTEIKVDPKNENYKSLNDALYTKNGEVLIKYPARITAKAFTVPETVVTIEEEAFAQNWWLEKVVLSKSVKTIGDKAFVGNRGLEEVKNLSSVKTMGSDVFDGTFNLELSVNLAKAPDGWAKDWASGKSVVWTRSAEVMEANRKAKEAEKERKEAEAHIKENFLIEKVAGSNTLKKYKGQDEYVIIPKKVENIDKEVFKGNNVIRKVRFTSAVYIKDEAFADCVNLQEVIFDEKIKGKCYIGAKAFLNCKNLMRVRLPRDIKIYDDNDGFYPNKGRPFQNCGKLIEIYDPSFFTVSEENRKEAGSIGFYAKNIYTPTSGESKLLIDDNGYVLYRDDNEIILMYYNGMETDLVLPEDITQIYKHAFYGRRDIKTITIPNSVTSIGDSAFDGCSSLTDVYITDIAAWYKIDFFNFSSNPLRCAKNLYLNNELITELVIPNTVTEIKKYAFSGFSGLASVTIPNSVISIGDNAFSSCFNLKSVYITDIAAWYKIDFFDFSSNPLSYEGNLYINNELVTELVIPKTVREIKKYAFCGCSSLTSVEIPTSIKKIERGTFCGCKSLTSVTIPSSVTSIGSFAFSGCKSLTSVEIPKSVTSIEEYAFSDCNALKNVTIPSSVTSIGKSVFNSCASAVIYVDLWGKPSAWSNTWWYGSKGVEWKKTEAQRAEEKSLQEERESIEELKKQGFEVESGELIKYIGEVSQVVIPEGITTIGKNAFKLHNNLTSVVIPDSVEMIGYNAFEGCRSLERVVIGKSVSKIDRGAFMNCGNLKKVIIPDSVKEIWNCAFYGCSQLKTVWLPKTITDIKCFVFENCPKLTIYAEATKRPKGWIQPLFGKESWNPNHRPVKWGAKKADFDKA